MHTVRKMDKKDFSVGYWTCAFPSFDGWCELIAFDNYTDAFRFLSQINGCGDTYTLTGKVLRRFGEAVSQ